VNGVYRYYAKCENVPNCTPGMGSITESVGEIFRRDT
jgi:hypothetical protein